MSVQVLLLKPAEPTVFDDMPSRPFHCTVLAHFPVTGSYAHVLLVSLSPEDENANQETLKSPSATHGALVLNGTRYEAEVLPLEVHGDHGPELAVSVADIGSG